MNIHICMCVGTNQGRTQAIESSCRKGNKNKSRMSSFHRAFKHVWGHAVKLASWESSIPEASGSMYEAMNRVRLFATVPARHKRNQQGMKKQKALPLKNDQITERELRVVFPEGDPLGTRILPLEEAKKEASQRGLDLVLASNQSDPPVARITSWEKLVFTMRQKEKAQERAARENRKLASPKEIRIGCHIAPHDLDVKLSSARKILQDNHLLKVSVTFKGGREIEPAKKVLDDILQSLSSLGRVKDPKHVQKAQMNRWAVQLEPIPSSSSSSSSSTL